MSNDDDGLEEVAVARRKWISVKLVTVGTCGTLLAAFLVTLGIFAAKPNDL